MARLPDNNTHTFRFSIPSSNGKTEYIVAKRKANSVWECSCRGYISTHKPCKHLKSTEVERMKLEKAFGANNKAINAPPASASDWKKAFESAIPPENNLKLK